MFTRNGDTKLRTQKCSAKYRVRRINKGDVRECFVCETKESVETIWELWRVIPNEFPYDAIAEEHVMLVPARHFADKKEMTIEESEELKQILRYFNESGEYDAMLENFNVGRTFLPHFHIHLLRWLRI